MNSLLSLFLLERVTISVSRFGLRTDALVLAALCFLIALTTFSERR